MEAGMAEDGELLESMRARIAASGFHSWAGIEVVSATPGEVTVATTVSEQHINLQGLVHGGMLAILADTACGLSIRSAMEPGRLHITTDLDIHFLSPARPGTLFGRGKAIKVGRSLAFAEASVEDADGKLLARAQSRFSVSGREPEGS
jgi:uncharacterized protein (TIGR00369 family)